MLSKWTIMGRWATWRASRSGLAGIITEPGRLTLGLWWQVRPMPMPLTRKVNAFAGVCISVYLHCNSRNCSQPAKKFRGFPFFQFPISINSDLFRISDFGFRISGFGFPAPAGLRKRSPVQRRCSPFACQSPLRSRADADAGVGFRIQGQRACRTEEVAGGGRYLFLLGLIHAAQAPA